jgi:hypothetical protein
MILDEPVLVRRSNEQQGRGVMQISTYVERQSRDDDGAGAREVTIAKAIGRLLAHHYPGHPWSVEVSIHGGYATIGIPPLLGPNWGYILHLNQIDTESGMKRVVEAGGHILERFQIPRSGMDPAAYAAILKSNPLAGMYRAKDRHRIPG